jgi:hypothetical protein
VREVLNDRYQTYEVEDVEEHEEGEYKATLIETIDDADFLQSILANAVPRSEHEKLGVAWFEEYYINGVNQGPATDMINENFDTAYDRTSFLNVFLPAFQKGILGSCVEKAIHENYYPECELKAGQSEPDLVHPDYIVEIKARRAKDKRRPLKLIEDEAYLEGCLKRKHPVKLVVVSYGKQSCIIKTYDLAYIDAVVTVDVN